MTSLDMTPAYPARPGFGKAGKKIQLLANFFQVKASSQDLFHYDVQITPSGLPKDVNRAVMAQLYQNFSQEMFKGIRPAYDGEASFYMPSELPFVSRTEKVKLEDRRDEFSVKVEKVAVINMESLQVFLKGKQHLDIPQDCIQALDVVLKTTPAINCTLIGSSFFSGLDRSPLGSGGAEIWRGYYQSLRPCHGRLLVNLDTAATCFYISQPVLKLLADELNCRDVSKLTVNDRRKMESILKGLKIEVTHRGKMRRKYRLGGIANVTADSQTFEIENEDGTKTKTNVSKYFKERYNLTLKYPKLPLVKVGSSKNPIFLPLEVCKIVGGERVNKKLTPAQTAAMIKLTAQKPDQRMKTIQNKFFERDYSKDPSVAAFGLKVDPKPVELTGRVIPPPQIVWSQNKVSTSQMGAWKMNGAYYTSTQLAGWGVLVLEPRTRKEDMTAFVDVLCKSARSAGFQVNPRPAIIMPPRNQRANYQDIIMRAVDQVQKAFQGQCQMLLIVLPFQDSSAYAEIKRVCDTVVDVPSQCMLSKHVQKKNPMYCSNILLKMNVKMGGINSVIDRAPSNAFLFNKPAIVFGADVSHAAPGSSVPSFAAVVASMDATPYRFETQMRAQASRQEMIAELQGMSRNHLISFFRATGGRKPEKILFYRDGVSEGQYDKVLSFELNALRAACASLEADYTPTITFVICAKRHHARFFCKNPREADRSGNVPPGTVVDTDVVHPRQFDFYLVSHSGIQGTSRPCHYHVLWDENKFTPDLLQQLTYRQCFMYARCQRSVSLVPAAYYAHLAAFRARHHAKADEWDSPSSSDTAPVAMTLPQVKPRNAKVMYFM